MTKDKLMVDIETLGLDVESAILSIGAVRFDSGGLGETFYREIDLVTCQDAGLEIDADTLQWWLTEADTELPLGDNHLENVLREFRDFALSANEVWSNSPSFDCEHLEHAFDAVGLDVPWTFYEERDVRTLKELPIPVEIEQDGTEHNALDDAVYQARIVSQTLKEMKA